MNLSVRGLSVFLIVLQLLTPLIHAHKNESGLVSAFHLPEFEQINQIAKNDSVMLVSATQNDQVVTVSAGMKNNKRRFLFDDFINFFLTLSFLIQNTAFLCFIPFFIEIEPIKIRIFNLALPRAPPHFLKLLCVKKRCLYYAELKN